jgi:hypothetical protein
MKTFFSVLAVAAATASASCPNMCSGHGSCNSDDACDCWQGWQGYDCSLRECPYVESWASDHVESAHFYAECAGKGLCDRSTGLCQCFDGYEGRGCERSSCPNDCSGHGKCRLLSDLPEYAHGKLAAGSWSAYTWDEKAITACICDGGYMGPDCSERMCPHGDDPMTVCEQGDVEQVQRVRFHIAGDDASGDILENMLSSATAANTHSLLENGQFALRFKTTGGEVLYTQAIDGLFDTTGGAAATVAGNIESALESLPNFAVKAVTVTHDDTTGTPNQSLDFQGTAFRQQFYVTFNHVSNGNSYGEQNLLQCPHERTFNGITTFGCGAAGCQPKVLQPRVVSTAKSVGTGTNFAVETTAGASVAFSPQSVLTCPRGMTCTGAGTNEQQGFIIALFADDASGATHVWVYGDGKAVPFTNADPGWDVSSWEKTQDLAAGDGAVYYGKLADFPTVGSKKEIDISAIMPDTQLWVDPAITTTEGDNVAFELGFTTATCEEVVDVTTDATVDAEVGYLNLDVENIECSGRGLCDRSSGQCKCFQGYHGLSCGSLTVLV